VIGDNALAVVEIDCLAVFDNRALLVWRDELELGFQVLLTHWRSIFLLARHLNIFMAESFVGNR
jgi:hypothetical protein